MGILKDIFDESSKRKGDAKASPKKKSDDEIVNEWLSLYQENMSKSSQEQNDNLAE